MKISEILKEDDYYADWGQKGDDNRRQAQDDEDLEALAEEFTENNIGIPPGRWVIHRGEIRISTERKDHQNDNQDRAKAEWTESGEALIEQLQREGFGDWHIAQVSQSHVQVAKD